MGQLKSFAAYGQTAPYLPFAANALVPVAIAPQVLIDLDGNAAASGWLQLHDVAAASALSSGSTVPLKSFQVAAAGPLPSLFQQLGGVTFFNGLCIAMSSTETVYTSVATSFDAFGEVDDFDGIDVTRLGTSTTSANNAISITPWASGGTTQGLHKLYKVTATDRGTNGGYVQIFAKSPVANDKCLTQGILPAAGSVIMDYGDSGFVPFSKDAAVPTNNLFDGCYIFVSTTSGFYTASENANLKAWWV